MKKRVLILICVLGITLLSAGVACATLVLNFGVAGNSQIEFVGGATPYFQFDPSTTADSSLGFDLKITGGSGTSDSNTIGLFGVISGTYQISAITGSPPFETGTVSGLTPPNTITITDENGKDLVLGVDWLTIYTISANGGMNASATANLTFISYTGGSNPDLLAFEGPGGSVNATFQFSSSMSLDDLTAQNADNKTSFSGNLAVPLPPSALLLGTGLLGLVGFGYRRKRKS